METYGDPHLHPGYYPIKSEYDNGGCNADFPAYSKPLVENYGDIHLHSSCYPQAPFKTMCNRDRSANCGVGIGDASGAGGDFIPVDGASYNEGALMEGYGDPHLHPGDYPDSSAYNTGGCMMEPHMGAASCDDVARANERKKHMEQRAGNNPFVYEDIPKYAQQGFIVGTGCMNPGCHCKNCQGDCYCGANMQGLQSYIPAFTNNYLLNLLIFALIAYFLYKKFIK